MAAARCPKPLFGGKAGRLGGLAAARKLSKEQRQARATAGGNAVKMRYGQQYFVAIAAGQHA